MLLFIIKWVIISFILIILIHNIFLFLKTTLTIPKVRDLVNKPNERYNEMINTINNSNKYKDIIEDNKDNMQDELSIFLQDLKKNSNVLK
jgi:hypothetical protein